MNRLGAVTAVAAVLGLAGLAMADAGSVQGVQEAGRLVLRGGTLCVTGLAKIKELP